MITTTFWWRRFVFLMTHTPRLCHTPCNMYRISFYVQSVLLCVYCFVCFAQRRPQTSIYFWMIAVETNGTKPHSETHLTRKKVMRRKFYASIWLKITIRDRLQMSLWLYGNVWRITPQNKYASWSQTLSQLIVKFYTKKWRRIWTSRPRHRSKHWLKWWHIKIRKGGEFYKIQKNLLGFRNEPWGGLKGTYGRKKSKKYKKLKQIRNFKLFVLN